LLQTSLLQGKCFSMAQFLRVLVIGSIFTAQSFAQTTHPLFSASFLAAKDHFRERVQRLTQLYPGATARRLELAPDEDSRIAVDFFQIPALEERQNLLVIVSGVHGAEFPAGAVAQDLLMDRLSSIDFRRSGVVFIHGVNPYGAIHGRRVNENNVDLNRNFAQTAPPFSQRLAPESADFSRLSNLLRPEGPAMDNPWERAQFYARFAGTALIEGRAQLRATLGRGQYLLPNAIAYGGEQHERQTVFIASELERVLPTYRNLVLLDVHTGLGNSGTLHLITHDTFERARDLSAIEEVVGSEFDERLGATEPWFELATADTPGFYSSEGDIVDFVRALHQRRPGARSVTLTVEFGTRSTGPFAQMATVFDLVAENRGWHSGFASERDRERILSAFSELFIPRSEEWRQAVALKCEILMGRAIQSLNSAN
jgi:hypothetical protein